MLARSASVDAAEQGFRGGHLKIVSSKEVDLADGTPRAITSESYAEYPLIIPPGDYVLDVQGRSPGHVRAKPQQFTVVSNQTVRVDMDIDTGVR